MKIDYQMGLRARKQGRGRDGVSGVLCGGLVEEAPLSPALREGRPYRGLGNSRQGLVLKGPLRRGFQQRLLFL